MNALDVADPAQVFRCRLEDGADAREGTSQPDGTPLAMRGWRRDARRLARRGVSEPRQVAVLKEEDERIENRDEDAIERDVSRGNVNEGAAD